MNNPLHSRANLFANGEFGALLPSGRKVVIIGYTHYNNIVFPDGKSHNVISTDGCHLLARPIDGMTRQELEQMPVFDGSELSTADKIMWLKQSTDLLSIEDIFFLIDNGVYPFDPNHFKEGIVFKHNGNT